MCLQVSWTCVRLSESDVQPQTSPLHGDCAEPGLLVQPTTTPDSLHCGTGRFWFFQFLSRFVQAILSW